MAVHPHESHTATRETRHSKAASAAVLATGDRQLRARQKSFSQARVRAFDLAVATIGIIVLFPIVVATAMAVKLTSKGPVLFRSPRLGSVEPEFMALKFRSMYTDADERLEALLRTDADVRAEYATFRKLHDDPRLTPIGPLIRRSSIDEIPQLLNVLKGEMSIVGPRPKLLNERERFGDALPIVLQVKPGLTGLWQVSGRNKLTVEERIVLDLQYVNERTMVGDAVICLRTFLQLWRPSKHGAL